MNPSIRIDPLSAMSADAYSRKTKNREGDGKDLFTEVLGQHLARRQDDTAAKTSSGVRPAASSQEDAGSISVHTDRTPENHRKPASAPTEARRNTENDDSRELGRRAGRQQGTPDQARPQTKEKVDSPSDEAGIGQVSDCTRPIVATATSDAGPTASTSPAKSDEATVGVQAEIAVTKPTSLETPVIATPDPAGDLPVAPAPVQPGADAVMASPMAISQNPGVPAILLLSGASDVTDDGIALSANADAEILAKLLAGRSAGNPGTVLSTPGTMPPIENAATTDPTVPAASDVVPAPSDRPISRAAVGSRMKAPVNTQANPQPAIPETTIKPGSGAAQTQGGLAPVVAAATSSTIELPEGISVAGDSEVWGDIEFSAWSQQLGSGAAAALGRNVAWRQGAFLAELKQNLPGMAAHEQVAVQIQRAAQNGLGRLTVDLQPAELGRVEIKLHVDKDKNVTATVIVDRPATLDILQRDARSLERILQDAGLQADSGSLSFSLRDSGGDGRTGSGNAGGKGGETGPDSTGTAKPAGRADVVATADGYVDLET